MNSSPSEEAKTDALLRATLETIAAHGLKGATTRLIAQQAGVNEVTIFRRYGTKTGLIRAAVMGRASLLGDSAVQYSGDLQADLIHLTEQYLSALSTMGPVVRVLISEFSSHPELSSVLDGPRALFGKIAALLLRYQQEGKLRPEPMSTLLPALTGPLVLPYLIPEVGPLLMQSEHPPTDAKAHVERFLWGRANGEKT